mmetsp:Transcript_9045/g.17057  ORF Transcript_9045/g.17057 Transcript_9045/m.17057 type:complete len:350 (-) Transcript_9045:141-1190(-)
MITSKRNSVSVMLTEQEKRIEAETQQLLVDIQRVRPEGEPYCLFGDLFVDPKVEQYYEALVGTLKAAKKKGLIYFDGQILFKGMHDHVRVSIVTKGNKTPTTTPPRKSSGLAAPMTSSQSELSPAKKSSRESSSSKINNDSATVTVTGAVLLTPRTKKDCFTQTSTSSTKKSILTPSHLRNQTWKNNIDKERNIPSVFKKQSSGEYKKSFIKVESVISRNQNHVPTPRDSLPTTSSSLYVAPSISITPDEFHPDIIGEGQSSSKPTLTETHLERVEREIRQLLLDIKRIEPKEEQFCSFGDLFVDEHVEQYYEALVGTLKAAKRKGLIHFQGQMLFKGLHDHVQIKIVE